MTLSRQLTKEDLATWEVRLRVHSQYLVAMNRDLEEIAQEMFPFRGSHAMLKEYGAINLITAKLGLATQELEEAVNRVKHLNLPFVNKELTSRK